MAKPTLSEISKLFKTDDKPTDFHYYGTVVSADVENRTYEVSINRDENITVEAARLVGAHVGDTVMVTVMANGYATVTGRVGGDTDASDAQRKADSASTIADQAQTKAISALSKATAAEQLASQAEQNAKRSADAAEEAEESAGLAAEAAGQAEQNARDSQTAAETAQQNAADSQTAAEAAQQNADGSRLAAQQARDRAIAAEGFASDAQEQAGIAKQEAAAANSYAVGALNSLSTTQDIIGVLSWVEESIKYVWDYPPTVEDKEYDPSKQYYTVIGKRVIDPIETDYDKYYVLNSESEPASKTGNIVTFDSYAEKLPLNKLTATINPKQDLHGYDKPWVGGSGKNKFNPQPYTGIGYNANIGATVTLTEASATFENNTISYTIEAWYNRVFRTPKLAQGSYKISMTNIAITSPRVSVYEVSGTDNTIVGRSNYSELPTDWEPGFSITESGNYFVLVIGSNTAQTISFSYPQIEAGSIKTTYSPYANICPISGWDEVNTYAYGANMCPTTPFERGQYVNNAWNSETDRITTDFIPIKPNTDYYMQIDIPEVKSLCFINYNYFDANKTWLGNRTTNGDVSINGLKQYTVNISNTNTAYLRVTIRRQDNMDMSSLTLADANLFLSVGNTITTTLPQTVYGGTLDVVSGVLTVDRAMVDLGTLNWAYNASWGGYPAFYVTTAPDNILPVYVTSKYPQNYICQGYEGYTRDYLNAHDITGFCIPPDGKISIRDSRYTDAATFKTAMSGVMLVYELATPTTIQCDPQTVQTLIGDNNVWADSGDVTVEYWDGPVGYVTPTSSFDPTETYYTVKGSPVKIDESKQEEHGEGLYYVHDLTNAKEAMADFIKAHLALTDEGLYVLKGPYDWRVLVANDGVYIIDPQGRRVASYKDSITLGTSEGNSIRITSEAITFNIGDKTFAYVAQDKWFASNAEVSGAMYIGDYSLRQKSNGDFVLGRRR